MAYLSTEPMMRAGAQFARRPPRRRAHASYSVGSPRFLCLTVARTHRGPTPTSLHAWPAEDAQIRHRWTERRELTIDWELAGRTSAKARQSSQALTGAAGAEAPRHRRRLPEGQERETERDTETQRHGDPKRERETGR
ncbi:hypothetical protein CDD83_8991 [Cordyceps sp. RAO-2017]|nr:hypothetical protein CDD83_8991 [Cordyceps sp. RAO-2017]